MLPIFDVWTDFPESAVPFAITVCLHSYIGDDLDPECIATSEVEIRRNEFYDCGLAQLMH